jgi:hypothetical protein
MDQLVRIVSEEVRKYASDGRAANGRLFLTTNEQSCTYAVTSVGTFEGQWSSHIVVLARVVEDHVVIEEDRTNKPLLDALLQRGIQRQQIVLSYQGEAVPDAETYHLA